MRVGAAPDGAIVVARNAAGRGAWLCRGSERCLDLALARDGLARALRRDLPPDAAETLRRCIGVGACGRM